MSVQSSFSTKTVARNKADLIPCSIGLSLDEQCCADNTNSKKSIEDFNDKNLVLKLRCIKTRWFISRWQFNEGRTKHKT